LRAEIGSHLSATTLRGDNKKVDHFIKSVNSDEINLYKLSDIGLACYNDEFKTDECIEDDEPITCDEQTESRPDSTVGYVYLLKAAPIWNNVYKIGITQNFDARLKQLNNCNDKYGAFGFKEVFKVKINYYDRVEKILHSYFHKYRISRDKECADTELFIGHPDIENKVKEVLKFLEESSQDFSLKQG
jgi:predicted GIY-YIG superfamily endonuclease